MNSRLHALKDRLRESAMLSESQLDRLKYLTAVYWNRVQVRAPKLLPSFETQVQVRVGSKPLHAIVRTNGSDWGVLKGIFGELEYGIPETLEVRRILDLGGNCGYASMFLGARYPEAEIITVEPISGNAATARRNLAANSIKAEVVQAAVGVVEGEADMYLTGNDSCESLTPIHNWTHKIKVPTVTVASLLARKNWDHVDLLKVDIEGYEKELFRGSPPWLEHVGHIIGELHGDYTMELFARDISPFGFKVKRLSDGYEKTFWASRNFE